MPSAWFPILLDSPDFVISSNYCLIGTRFTRTFFLYLSRLACLHPLKFRINGGVRLLGAKGYRHNDQ